MALTSAQSVSAASLVVYILTLPPLLYVLTKHGKHGFLGWFFLTAFAMLQIIAGGLNLSDNPGTAGPIISTIGLSPLLLAAQGVLHEAQLKVSAHGKRDLIIYILIHFVVVTGVALTGAGASGALAPPKPTDPSNPTSIAAAQDKVHSDLTLWKTGAALLAISWVLIAISALATVFTLPSARPTSSLGTHSNMVTRNASILAYAVLVALPFIAVRTFYGLVYAVTQSPWLSATAGADWVRVVLQFLPMLAACWALVAGGLRTRRITETSSAKMDVAM